MTVVVLIGNTLDPSLGLFELDQRAAEILRMQKKYGLAVGADFQLAVTKHTRALSFEHVSGRANVPHLVAEVMNASVRIAFKKFSDRRIRSQRLKKLDLRVGQRYENGGNAVVRLRHLVRNICP